MACPSCKQTIEASHHPELNDYIEEAKKLQEKIHQIAVERGKHEGLIKEDEKEMDDNSINDLLKKMSFYQCYL